MEAQLKADIASLEFELNLNIPSESGSGHPAWGWSALNRLETKYSEHYLLPLTRGIFLENITTRAPSSGSWLQTLDIPALGISETESDATYSTSLTSRLVLTGVKLYCTSTYWRLDIATITWHNNAGSTAIAGGPWTIDSSGSSPQLSPITVPLIGVPATMSGTSTAAIDPIDLAFPPYLDHAASVEAVTTGGWEADGVSYPVDLNILAAPALDPPFGNAPGCDFPSVSATTTSDFAGICRASAVFEGGADFNSSTGTQFTPRSFEVTLLPSLSRGVVRGNLDGYAALILRGGFPKAEAVSTHVAAALTPGPPHTAESRATWFDRYVEDIEEVGQTSEHIEEPFSEPLYCPYELGASSQLYPPDSGGTRSITSQYPVLETSASNGALYRALDSADDLGRYVGMNASPHWAYFYEFPTESATDPYAWYVNGSIETPENYWLVLRDQLGHHPDLANASEARRSLISAPLLDGALASYIESNFTGFKTSFWGVCGFDVETLRTGGPKAPDSGSSAAWTFKAGDGSSLAAPTFGAGGITIQPKLGDTTVVADYDIGRFSETPFQATHIGDRIEVTWTNTNIVSVVVSLVGVDDETVVLTNNVEGTFARPRGPATKFAGSWGQDFGVGAITDTGADIGGDGISAATMADAERNFAFQLLPGRTAAKLRYTITVTDPATTIEIQYPNFYQPAVPVRVLAETGCTQTVFWRLCGAVRYGQWSYWNYSTDVFRSTPVVGAIGLKTSALDWLCFSRHAFQGIASSSGLDAALGAMYDSVEAPTGSISIRQQAAYDTVSFVHEPWPTLEYSPEDEPPFQGVMVNGYSTPPLACFPQLQREDLGEVVSVDGVDVTSGTYVQHSYSWAYEPRVIIVPGDIDAVLQSDGSPRETWSSHQESRPDWTVASQVHELTGDENDDFYIVFQGDDKATVAPSHGYLAVLFKPGESGGCISYDVSTGNIHAVAYLDGSDVYVAYSDNAFTAGFVATNIGVTAEWVCIRWDRRGLKQRLWLYTEESGAVKRRYSDDDGKTFSVATSIATGTKPALVISDFTRLQYEYWIDGTDLKGEIRDAAGTVVHSVFTVTTGVDDEGIGVDESIIKAGQHRIILLCSKSGTVTRLTSFDGKTFT